MLPETLAGSYQRYKSDTNAFTTWLSRAAQSCGYTPKTATADPQEVSKPEGGKAGQSLAEKLREKAAKKAAKKEEKKQADSRPTIPPTVKYTLKTSDLVRQAEIVSKNAARIRIPDNVFQVVGRAIDARKRCTAWFLKTGLESESTDTHLHFIGVLEKVVQMLNPASSNTNTRPSKLPSTKNDVDVASLSNRFSILEIEDTEDILDTTMIVATPAAKQTSATKTPTVYELEQNLQAERVFETFCFFEDMHRIQDFLDETWSDYKKDEMDLMTAAMLTNIAIDMVRRAEQNIINFAFPKAAPHDILSYKKLAQLIFHTDSFSESEGPSDVTKAVLRITPFDNFIYLSTARTLFKFEAFRRGMYPHPVPPASMQYVFAQEMLGLPEVKKMDQEDRFLSQWLMDSGYRYGMETARTDPDRMATPYQQAFHEEITQGFLRLQEIGEVSTWMVFASRIFQDIQEILGDSIQKPYEELLDTKAMVAVQLDVEEDKKFSFARGDQWSPSVDMCRLLIGLHSDCTWIDYIPLMKAQTLQKNHIVAENSHYYHTLEELEQAFPEMGRQRELRSRKEITMAPPLDVVEQRKGFKIQPISPSPSPTFVYDSNPMYSGTFAFKAICGAEEAGIALQNHHQSIFFTAHLYNALKQSELIKSDWTEMDELIEIHKATWFAGQIPDTLDALDKRFCHCLGISIQGRSRNARNPNQNWKIRKGFNYGPQVPRNKVAEIFKHHFDQKKPLEWCILEVAKLNQQGSSASTTKAISKRQQHQPQQTPVQLLTHMKTNLSPAIKAMQQDYMPLVRICDKLLKKCRSHINTHLNGYKPYPTADTESLTEKADLGLSVMISGMLLDAMDFKLGLYRPTKKPQLEMVAPLFENIIKYRNSGAAQEAFKEARRQQDARVREMMGAMDQDFHFGMGNEGSGGQLETAGDRLEAYNMPPRHLRGLDI